MTATLLPSGEWAVILYTLDGCFSVTVPESKVKSFIVAQWFGAPRVSARKALAGAMQAMLAHLASENQEPRFRSSQLGLRHVRNIAPFLPLLEEFRHHEYSHMHLAKVGVLYQARGQTEENQFYCNATGSADFDFFLSWLGDRVQLQGYTGYRGGLDVRRGHTGAETVVARFSLRQTDDGGLTVASERPDADGVIGFRNSDGEVGCCYDVLFHVSTMLPTSRTDEQQVEKKRHIGNDNIVIVYSETPDDMVTAQTLTSKMLMMVVNVWPAQFYPAETPMEARRFCFQAMTRRGLDTSEPLFSQSPLGLPLDEALHRAFIEKIMMARLGTWSMPELRVKLLRMRRDGLERIGNLRAGKTPTVN